MTTHPALLQASLDQGLPIRTEEEARALLVEFETAMSDLLATIEEETTLVKAGRLFAATDLSPRKNDLLGRYLRTRTRLKTHFASMSHLIPETADHLRELHLASQEALRTNLAVLAIAREVAEGIVRNVSTAVGRAASPKTYGRNAAMPPVRLAAARGIAVDRRL
jgi:hypothetical protein